MEVARRIDTLFAKTVEYAYLMILDISANRPRRAERAAPRLQVWAPPDMGRR